MTSANYRVRRATLDDIEPLTKLWQSMHFPVDELAKRITDFQVVETSENELVGAVGVQMLERQGRVHSEAFTDFGVADHLRPQLWDRLQRPIMDYTACGRRKRRRFGAGAVWRNPILRLCKSSRKRGAF